MMWNAAAPKADMWAGQTGVQLQPLVDAPREAMLAQCVVHSDETPVQMLAPGGNNLPHLNLGLHLYAGFGTQSRGLRIQP